jgi:hypothetical protein
MHDCRCQDVYISATVVNVSYKHSSVSPQLPDATVVFQIQIDHGGQRQLPTAPTKVAERTLPAESSNPILASPMPPTVPNEITNNNSGSIHNQRAITYEGGHTNDELGCTSEGANALTISFSPELFSRRLLRHGHCQHDHRAWKSPLFPETT